MGNIQDKFKTLIKKEKLNDFSIYFNEYESYEEIPLFSRYKNISFLSGFSFNEKNKLLIRQGVELIGYIREVSSDYLSESELEDYFICLSITDLDFHDYKEVNCLSPHIYVSRRKKWLLSSLDLSQKKFY
ncbi:Imm15 family immunity protein [Pseudescherichia vulneris]